MKVSNDFLYFIRKDILEQIDIDERLIPYFINVMKKLHQYFSANDYLGIKDYKEYIEKYLLSEEKSKKFKFEVSDEPSKIGAAGFYVREENRICVDISYINAETQYIEHILCHEIIHFLVMQEIKNIIPTFVNEALTEMLTRQIYPNDGFKSYEPQVKMLEFVNLLTGNVNNYKLFLSGGIDSYVSSPQWYNFFKYTKEYTEKFSEKGYSMITASKDESYINAQRKMIQLALVNIDKHSFYELKNLIEKILCSPVKDEEYIDKEIKSAIRSFIANNGININNPVYGIYCDYLQKYIENIKKLHEYSDFNEPILITTIGGVDVLISKSGDCKVTKKVNYSISTYGNIRKIKINGETKEINISTAKFVDIKEELLKEQHEIEKIFTENLQNINSFLMYLSGKTGLKRLEKYELQGIEKKNLYIFVAIFDDYIEILDKNFTRLNNIVNLELNKLKGYIPNSLILNEKIGYCKQSRVYSVCPESKLKWSAIKKLKESKINELTDEQVTEIIESYKQTQEYINDQAFFINEKKLRNAALDYYFSNEFEKLSIIEQQKIIDSVINDNIILTIGMENGELVVATMHGNRGYISPKSTLYDSTKESIFKEIIEKMKQTDNIQRKLTNIEIIKIVDGDLDYTENSNVETNISRLERLQERLKFCKFEYQYTVVELERLINNNQNKLTIDYNEQLNNIMYDIDKIVEEIRYLNLEIRKANHTDEIVDSNKLRTQRYREIIDKIVSKLKLITLFDTHYFEIKNGNIPEKFYKDADELEDQKIRILTELRSMLGNNEITLDEYKNLFMFINNIYDVLLGMDRTKKDDKKK